MLNKRNYIKYIIGAMLIVALIVSASILDMICNVAGFSVLVKLAIFVALLSIAIKGKLPFLDSCSYKYFLIALVPLMFSLAMNFRLLNVIPDASVIVWGMLGVLATVLVEEFYYRVGILYFFKKEKLRYKSIVALSLSMFTIGLFLKTKNIMVALLAHLSLNLTALVFQMFSKSNALIGNWGYVIVSLIRAAVLTAVGTLIFKSNRTL